MCPKNAIERAVRVAIGLSERVMKAMRRNPRDRAGLQGERSADGHKMLKPTRRLKSAVRVKAVVAEANAPTACDPPGYQQSDKIRPRKGKDRPDRKDMKQGDKEHRVPMPFLAIDRFKINNIIFHVYQI